VLDRVLPIRISFEAPFSREWLTGCGWVAPGRSIFQMRGRPTLAALIERLSEMDG